MKTLARRPLVASLLVVACAANAAAKDPPKPSAPPAAGAKPAGAGTKWKVTVTTSMPGSPIAPPPSSYEFCQTEQQAVPVNPQEAQQSGCQVTSQQFDGRTASWKMRCDKGMAMTGEGSISYDGDAFRGQSSFKGQAGGQAFEMSQSFTGQKLGACKP